MSGPGFLPRLVPQEAMTKAKCNYPKSDWALLPVKHVLSPFRFPFPVTEGQAVLLRTLGMQTPLTEVLAASGLPLASREVTTSLLSTSAFPR